jgi:sucrose-6-phosphate hydrolase SacC (GH32 family)
MKTLARQFHRVLPVIAAFVVLLFNISCATRTSPSMAAAKSVYLFTSFHDADQKFLRFLYSYDGYHWTNVPGTFLAANVGVSKQFRDPSIVRGPDGTFHLVWTAGWHGDQGFGYASSKDLIHWSEQKFISVMMNEPTTVNVWAPEIFFDHGQFIIVWASTIPGRFPDALEKSDNNHRLYYTTTRDFKTFATAKLFFEPGFSVIDGFVLKDAGRYVLVHKDNTRPMLNLRVAFGDSPLGAWSNISAPFTQKFTEGPCALKVGADWLVYFDSYRDKIYGAMKTRDFKTFTDVTKEVSFPLDHKHGTAFYVAREILDDLLKNSVSLTSTNL